MNEDEIKIIDKILQNSPDPLGVRRSTFKVLKNSKLVKINLKNLKRVVEFIKEKIRRNDTLTSDQFGDSNPTPQLIFILDSINFCFWAGKNEEKWTVEYPRGNFISNGWFALVACFQRAIKEDFPILDASYLKNLSYKEAKYIFRSSNNKEIPLLKERVKILNQVGETLEKKYQGNIYNLLAKLPLEAGKIALKIIEEFPSFEDFSFWSGERVNFYKRAQIFTYDLSFLPSLRIKKLEELTLFADYKVPQILRALGVLEYSPLLEKKIDSYQILQSGRKEELEIRASTIWAGEIIAFLADLIPAKVDNVLWKAAQLLKDSKPHHRVLTTAY
ncbi:MAG: queuosine salvage family protein [Microgenomates group bacterium]